MPEAQDPGRKLADFPVVLFVCTANRCRSPMAELLLRARLPSDWQVWSAGTRAIAGQPMHPSAVQVLAERGIADPTWLSTGLTLLDIERADLILTAEDTHRSVVGHLAASALARTWTLLHFAHLVAASQAGPPTADAPGIDPRDAGAHSIERLVSLARRGLSQTQPLPADTMNLADPITGSVRRFRRCADTIDAALARILG